MGTEDCQLSVLLSTLALRAYRAEQFFAGRKVLSCHGRMFSSTLDLYPPEVSSTPSGDNQKCL